MSPLPSSRQQRYLVECVALARSGDRDAMGRLLQLQRRACLRLVRRRLGAPVSKVHDAEDVFQDAALALLAQPHHWPADAAALRCYVCRAAANLALNANRHYLDEARRLPILCAMGPPCTAAFG